jgi:chemotaxis regulatin CheY-phosphate phosphatase CheZ
MSEESLAHKNQPPDAEYDSIYVTMAETAQGRRFLEEHARRSAPPEPDATLAAIQRMQGAMSEETGGRLDRFLLEMTEMAQALARARAEIAALEPPQHPGQIDATTEERDSTGQTTENTASRILGAAERVQELAWTLREKGIEEDFCNQLNAQATEIYTVCTFQDLTGQRTRKVTQVLRDLETRINAMVDICAKDAAAEEKSEQAAADDPCITGSLGQADADAVMQPDTAAEEEDRQDATLEDINRFMLALEPLMVLHHAAATEKSAEPVAAAPVEETRPELSVAATVMQEAEDAQALAEWFAEPSVRIEAVPLPAAAELPVHTVAAGAELEAPVAETEAPPPMAEWVVDGAPPEMQAEPAQAEMMPSPAEPEAPAPEHTAEPAWKVLQRLQTAPDFPQPEAEADFPEPPVEREPIVAAALPPEEIVPPPPQPAAPERAEPVTPFAVLSIATPQDEIIARLTAMLPPAELNFPRARTKAADPLDDLAAVLAATKIQLLEPGDGIGTVATAAAPEPEIVSPAAEYQPPQEPQAAAPELVELPAVVELPAAPEPRAAEIAHAPTPVEPPPPVVTAREEEAFSTAIDLYTDEFLFAPEPADETKLVAQPEARREEAPADFLLATAPPPAAVSSSDHLPPADVTTAAEEAAQPDPLPAMEWKSGSFPDPALVTPQTVPEPAVPPLRPKLAARAPYDPLASLRALSDDEKIALFS